MSGPRAVSPAGVLTETLGRVPMTKSTPPAGQMDFLVPLQLAKMCRACRVTKEGAAFPRSVRNKDGLYSYCRECANANGRRYYENNRDQTIARTTRWHQENRGKSREAVRQWRLRNPEYSLERKRENYQANKEEVTRKLRDAKFKRKYGISLEERDSRATLQSHQCAICGVNESTLSKRLAVDHDHETGAVRDLLCQSCNQGLGLFRDRPELLEAAAAYLRRHAVLEVPCADQVAVGR